MGPPSSLLLSGPVLSAYEKWPMASQPCQDTLLALAAWPARYISLSALDYFPHFGHHFRTLIYSPGPGRGHSLKDLSMESSPLRTLRGRKMPGEDKKESKGDLISELPGSRTDAEGSRALLAQRTI